MAVRITASIFMGLVDILLHRKELEESESSDSGHSDSMEGEPGALTNASMSYSVE